MSESNGTDRKISPLEIEPTDQEEDEEGQALIRNGNDDECEEEVENGSQQLAAAEYGDDVPVRVSTLKKRSAAKKKNGRKDDSPSSQSNAEQESDFAYVWRRLCMVGFVVVVAVVLLDWTSKWSEKEELSQDEERGIKAWLKKTVDILKSPSTGWSHGREVDYGAYQRKSADKLYKDVKAALDDLREQILRPDYGDYVESAFSKEKIFEAFVVPSNRSYVRLKRRIMKKVLEANVKGLAQSNQRTRFLETGNNETEEVKDPFSTSFVWINAGHSAAAGHGNLINQTSPFSLEEAAAGAFAAAGIRFYAKNYAMGGYSSRPELSFCMESIYGTDVDVLSWDFGMTDGGRNTPSYHIWVNRAAVHPTKPILFSFDNERTTKVHPKYDKQGMGTHGVPDYLNLLSEFPDCAESDCSALPPAVAYYRCGRGLENGDICEPHKWNTAAYCDKPRYQTSWHNGWKDHLFIGRIRAVYIVELLLEVVAELANKDISSVMTPGTHQHKTAFEDDTVYKDETKPLEEVPSDEKAALTTKFHQRLQVWDDEDRELFFKFPIDEETESRSFYGDALRGRAYCHSALLPSQFRYDGLVHTDGKPGHYEYAGMYSDFDIGCSMDNQNEFMKGASMSSLCPREMDADVETPFQVLFDEGGHNRCVYPVVFEIDFPEFFPVTKSFGKTGGLVPNKKEKSALDDAHNRVSVRPFSGTTSKAAIMVCLQQCNWGKCPGHVFQWGNYGRGNEDQEWSLTVDGEEAAFAQEWEGSNYCRLMLRDGRNPVWEKKNGDVADQFDIRFEVYPAENSQHKLLAITSVIVIQLHDESPMEIPPPPTPPPTPMPAPAQKEEEPGDE